MHKILGVLNVIAWVGAIGGSSLLALRIWGWYELEFTKVGRLRQGLAHLQGKRLYTPMKIPAIVSLLSIAWLLAR